MARRSPLEAGFRVQSAALRRRLLPKAEGAKAPHPCPAPIRYSSASYNALQAPKACSSAGDADPLGALLQKPAGEFGAVEGDEAVPIDVHAGRGNCAEAAIASPLSLDFTLPLG